MEQAIEATSSKPFRHVSCGWRAGMMLMLCIVGVQGLPPNSKAESHLPGFDNKNPQVTKAQRSAGGLDCAVPDLLLTRPCTPKVA